VKRNLSAVAVIPARYAATRLPGKLVLQDPTGRYLIDYVCAAAAAARRIERTIVATDHRRIHEVVTGLGWEAVMTREDHRSGSDRVAEVARTLEADVVVNIQGDEPQVRPEMIDQVVALLEESPECVVSTLACEITSPEELADPNVVKVVVDHAWRALYFSRLPIPYVRGAERQFGAGPLPHLHHIGIYAYRRDFLLRYVEMPPAPLEEAERLEQLRVLAAGERIQVGRTPHKLIGIDTPEDLERFCQWVVRQNP